MARAPSRPTCGAAPQPLAVATRRHACHNARSAPSFCPDAVQPAPAPPHRRTPLAHNLVASQAGATSVASAGGLSPPA
eukprot:1654862-Prymnesium_polylepis.1